MDPKEFRVSTILDPKKSLCPKIFDTKNRCPKNLGKKKLSIQNFLVKQNFFGPKNIWVKKVKIICAQENVWSMKYLGPKKFCPKKCWTSKINAPKKLGPKSLVNIGSVTAEIMPVWTNAATSYVARTNVTMTIGMC